MDTPTHMYEHRCVTHEHVSMHVYTHAHNSHICTHVHMSIHLHVYSHLCMCMHMYSHSCPHVCIYTHMHMHINAYRYTHALHTHIHACKHVYMCMYNMYTHTFKCCTMMFWPAMYHIYDHCNGTEKLLSYSDSHHVQPSACLVCLGCCGMHPTVLQVICSPAHTTEQCVLSSDRVAVGLLCLLMTLFLLLFRVPILFMIKRDNIYEYNI